MTSSDPPPRAHRWSRRRGELTPPIEVVRRRVLLALSDKWTTPAELAERLALDYYRVALICERLANDGEAEFKRPAPGKVAIVRRFRRRRPASE